MVQITKEEEMKGNVLRYHSMYCQKYGQNTPTPFFCICCSVTTLPYAVGDTEEEAWEKAWNRVVSEFHTGF